MKKSDSEPTPPGQQHRAEVPPVEAIQVRGEYKVRLTSLSIAVILVTGGIIFSLLYPASLTAIWSVITPIILTVIGLTLKNNDKKRPM